MMARMPFKKLVLQLRPQAELISTGADKGFAIGDFDERGDWNRLTGWHSTAMNAWRDYFWRLRDQDAAVAGEA